MSRSALAGLVAGALILMAVLVLPEPPGLSQAAWRVTGLALLMAIWWSTEPVPIAATSLLPPTLLPLLGIVDLGEATAPYSSPLIFLFLGGFLIAAAIRRWNLHLRFARASIRLMGTDPRRLVLGFMISSGLLSMWVSNTATVVLLLPVAASLVAAIGAVQTDERARRNFATALMIGLAYGASIGGMGTLIGSPPNALLAAYLGDRHGFHLSFAAWLAIAMPLVVVLIPLSWWLLVRVIFPVPAGAVSVREAPTPDFGLGPALPMTPGERRVAMVFVATAALWVVRPLLNELPGLQALSDPGIAMIASIALFMIPVRDGDRLRFLLDWREAREIPWQVLLLFGGGLSLASAVESSGLAASIGGALSSVGPWHPLLLLAALVTVVVLLTEIVSNTAAIAALLPIVASIATASGLDVVVLSVALTLSTSCAFMLPAATPPNTLVFASGHVSAAALLRAGAVMNAVSMVLITLLTAWALPPLLSGIRPG